VQSVFGYDGKSPKADQGSSEHIERWLRASAGGDSDEVARSTEKLGKHAAAKVISFD
jgi:hypothetical protein